MFALCHELGHLAARYQGYAVEQKSDKFAYEMYLPQIYEKFDNLEDDDLSIEREICKQNYTTELKLGTCSKMLRASLDGAKYRKAFHPNLRSASYFQQAYKPVDLLQCGVDIAKWVVLKTKKPVCYNGKH